MVRALAVTILLAFVAGAAVGKQTPDLAPAALARAFSTIGVKPGVVRTIEGVTVRLDKMAVASEGKWIVIRILPTRVHPEKVADK